MRSSDGIRTRSRWVVAALAVAVVVGVVVWAVARRDSSPETPAGLAASRANPATSAPPVATAGPSVRPSASASAATGVDACVAATVGKLSLDERVGQLLMIGTPVNAPRDLATTVGRYRLGGVFLAGRSQRPAAALRLDIDALQRAARMPLLLALDQEGGSVQTLKGPDFPVIGSAQRLGGGSSTALRTEARDAARRLAGIGITINLAPVADTVPTDVGEKNPPIGAFHRQYGSDPDRVAADIRTVVAASQAAGVLTTLKHFPGLGRVRANTDTSSKAVDSTATATDSYLKPFEAGIAAGSAAVMVSSASYPRLDPNAIAAFSQPIITGLLRGRLGYDGLVLSDDLGAADAVESTPAGDRAVRFVRAGGDVVLTIRPQDAAPMSKSLLSAARASKAFDARVTDAARHVVRAKYRAGLLKC
jgi:beta-N-acetylhexosaminidase